MNQRVPQQFLEFIRANDLDLFPQLLDQSQFNRRARWLNRLVEQMSTDLAPPTQYYEVSLFFVGYKTCPRGQLSVQQTPE